MSFRSFKRVIFFLPILVPAFFVINYLEDGATLRDSRVLLKQYFMIPDPVLAENVQVGAEWKEFTFPHPVDSYYNVHIVRVYTDAINNIHVEPPYMGEGVIEEFEYIHLQDGTKAKFEAILYDDLGGSYPLIMGPIGGKFVVFTKTRSKEENATLTRVNSYDFPVDRKYTSLKMRSDVPLHVEKIEWGMYIQVPWVISPIALFKQMMDQSD